MSQPAQQQNGEVPVELRGIFGKVQLQGDDFDQKFLLVIKKAETDQPQKGYEHFLNYLMQKLSDIGENLSDQGKVEFFLALQEIQKKLNLFSTLLRIEPPQNTRCLVRAMPRNKL